MSHIIGMRFRPPVLHIRVRANARWGSRKVRSEHNLDRRMRVYLAPKVPIVDESGIRPYDRESAITFFTLVSARYDRGSINLTSK